MSRRLKNKYLSRRKFARDGFGEKEEDDSGFFFFSFNCFVTILLVPFFF